MTLSEINEQWPMSPLACWLCMRTRTHAPDDGSSLDHLARMREYLAYSLSQVEAILQTQAWEALSPDQHESLAAFRVRFSEFQEHLGKTMRSAAIEEEQDVA